VSTEYRSPQPLVLIAEKGLIQSEYLTTDALNQFWMEQPCPAVRNLCLSFPGIYRKRATDIEWDWTTRTSGLFDNHGIGVASLSLH